VWRSSLTLGWATNTSIVPGSAVFSYLPALMETVNPTDFPLGLPAIGTYVYPPTLAVEDGSRYSSGTLTIDWAPASAVSNGVELANTSVVVGDTFAFDSGYTRLASPNSSTFWLPQTSATTISPGTAYALGGTFVLNRTETGAAAQTATHFCVNTTGLITFMTSATVPASFTDANCIAEIEHPEGGSLLTVPYVAGLAFNPIGGASVTVTYQLLSTVGVLQFEGINAEGDPIQYQVQLNVTSPTSNLANGQVTVVFGSGMPGSWAPAAPFLTATTLTGATPTLKGQLIQAPKFPAPGDVVYFGVAAPTYDLLYTPLLTRAVGGLSPLVPTFTNNVTYVTMAALRSDGDAAYAILKFESSGSRVPVRVTSVAGYPVGTSDLNTPSLPDVLAVVAPTAGLGPAAIPVATTIAETSFSSVLESVAPGTLIARRFTLGSTPLLTPVPNGVVFTPGSFPVPGLVQYSAAVFVTPLDTYGMQGDIVDLVFTVKDLPSPLSVALADQVFIVQLGASLSSDFSSYVDASFAPTIPTAAVISRETGDSAYTLTLLSGNTVLSTTTPFLPGVTPVHFGTITSLGDTTPSRVCALSVGRTPRGVLPATWNTYDLVTGTLVLSSISVRPLAQVTIPSLPGQFGVTLNRTAFHP
jgi:hypothetical protein